MTAKEYLKQIERMDVQIRQKQEALERLKAIAESHGGLKIDDRVQASASVDRMADIVSKYTDLEREIRNDIYVYNVTRNEVINVLHVLNNALQEKVLCLRYIKYMRFAAIADKTGYSIQHIFRLHSQGIEKVDKFLKDESK